jgi:hypothetical protein
MHCTNHVNAGHAFLNNAFVWNFTNCHHDESYGNPYFYPQIPFCMNTSGSVYQVNGQLEYISQRTHAKKYVCIKYTQCCPKYTCTFEHLLTI